MRDEFDTSYVAQDKDHERSWARYGKTWTEEEKESLYFYFDQGHSLKNLCMFLGRPARGILVKLVQARKLKERWTPAGGIYLRIKGASPTGRIANDNEVLLNHHINVDYSTLEARILAHEAAALTKELNMPSQANIETRTYIQGVDASTLSDSQLFETIAQLEAKCASLDRIQHKPQKLKDEIESLKADIGKIATYIDSREG